ncbi:MAG: ferrous iron transport protein A [Clostridia bacterium]|nr:ferrous iron transport protein A [Clostridia bacterium]
MNVCDMKAGEEALVEEIALSDEVKERFRYLNVTAGAPLTLLKVSFFKKTYLIQARSAKIAIGREVAEGIKVCRK